MTALPVLGGGDASTDRDHYLICDNQRLASAPAAIISLIQPGRYGQENEPLARPWQHGQP